MSRGPRASSGISAMSVSSEVPPVSTPIQTNLTWLQVVVGGDRIGRPAGVV
eukprot:CAMPEP_0170088928 /NCGR_PEP_ID=MMETSP0019_2-20121128/23107_1 /TAXON_ID=98059 /ORGANISM="Dinobryon sp., Strain UTEXLB2267" /LENGTH=50 /DNA_ID=CAMNT_0010307471 /DNA_START=13 /DNA_END=165 /DNA_ORIENTATION=-